MRGDQMIMGIDHVQMAMPAGHDAEARAFYGELLGLREVAKPAELAKRGGMWFENGRVKIHLGVEAEFRPARKAHPALLVKDLDLLIQLLTNAGYQLRSDEPLEGYNRAFVDDPFGNRIEFLEARPSNR
jgi:catechol 2,3-dioxygenase-like lactoylglutathione lyase family enzyme